METNEFWFSAHLGILVCNYLSGRVWFKVFYFVFNMFQYNLKAGMNIYEVLCFFGICVLGMALNVLLGYGLAFLMFAGIDLRQCVQIRSIFRRLQRSYSLGALAVAFNSIKKPWKLRDEVVVWVFFIIGSQSFFQFSSFGYGGVCAAIGLTVAGSCFLAFGWKSSVDELNKVEESTDRLTGDTKDRVKLRGGVQ